MTKAQELKRHLRPGQTYWIMHCLYGLQKLNIKFELKGGNSLSKGHKILGRFSEDIDIDTAIAPPGPDALFFAGDLGQRIFQPPFSWKGLGIDVRGR
jgi:Nucleotidyl transferase AbiEii toxin, Type IV TA system